MRILSPYDGKAYPVGYGFDLTSGPIVRDRPYSIPGAFCALVDF